jgi:hypothetical protein
VIVLLVGAHPGIFSKGVVTVRSNHGLKHTESFEPIFDRSTAGIMSRATMLLHEALK